MLEQKVLSRNRDARAGMRESHDENKPQNVTQEQQKYQKVFPMREQSAPDRKSAGFLERQKKR